MDAYDTEKEQIEKIKKWWDANGKAIIIGLTLGFGGIFGYRYWEGSKILAGESASTNYEHMLVVAQAGANEEATAAVESLISNQADSAYAKMAALLSAKLAVEDNDFSSAKKRLQWVIEQPKAGELAAIARARLAQILLAEGEIENALNNFNALKADEQARFPELNGDILLAQGNVDDARVKYQAALDQAIEFGIDTEPLQLKLDNMGFIQAQN